MKRFLISACVAGIVCAFYLSAAITIALMFIAFEAIMIFSPLIVSTYRFNLPILYIWDLEEDIIYILDRSKKSSRHEEWLTFDRIFSLTEKLNPNKDLPRNVYYIALSNLINKKMVEADSKNGEHVYRLIVECIPEEGMGAGFHCRQLPCAT